MKRMSIALPVTSSLALAAGLTFSGGLAVAQQAQRAGPQEEVTVEAPRLVRKTVGRSATSATNVELISLTRHVSYADLDLKLHADVMTLEQRVNDMAKEACQQLAEMYPLSDPNTPDCVESATKKAMMQVKDAAAAAEKG